MKFLKWNKNNFLQITKIGLLLVSLGFFTACSNDDNDIPEPINQEEVITTMNVVLTPQNGGETVVLTYEDLDGNGPNEAVVQGGVLDANSVYNGKITLLNESVDPAENITIEVKEEGTDHQFFFSNTAGVTTTYTDEDINGNPIGIQFNLETSHTGSGSLTVVLRHEPNKNAEGVANGTIENAGGETDILVTFPITVE